MDLSCPLQCSVSCIPSSAKQKQKQKQKKNKKTKNQWVLTENFPFFPFGDFLFFLKSFYPLNPKTKYKHRSLLTSCSNGKSLPRGACFALSCAAFAAFGLCRLLPDNAGRVLGAGATGAAAAAAAALSAACLASISGTVLICWHLATCCNFCYSNSVCSTFRK